MINNRKNGNEIAAQRRRGFFAYVVAAIMITGFVWWVQC